MLGAIVHSLLSGFKPGHVEPADVEGKKVVLTMLAVGGIFLLVIAVGEVSHMAAKARRRRNS